ncbi:MAG: hypothetical protein VXW51_04830, partial [Pseudomonadota bacterium]|nr:hypothetical protein [Pseudomonadota bacterium]
VFCVPQVIVPRQIKLTSISVVPSFLNFIKININGLFLGQFLTIEKFLKKHIYNVWNLTNKHQL